MAVTITPHSSNSKILVSVSLNICGVYFASYARIERRVSGSSNLEIFKGTAAGVRPVSAFCVTGDNGIQDSVGFIRSYRFNYWWYCNMDNERKHMKLIVTEKAKKIFRESTEDPYMRVGAKPGGCSGWMFTLESDTDVDITDSMYDDIVIIDTELHENVIGDLMVDYRDDNIVEQGFVFQRMSTGVVCGCGESFTPLGSTKKLGWDE